MPRPRAATALNLHTMAPIRCTINDYDTCPTAGRTNRGQRPKRPCGRLHPKPVPRAGFTVDDVAAQLPAGELVAMRDLLGDVRIVSPDDLRLFQEMTELSGEYQPGNNRSARGQAAPRTTACANTGHRRATPANQCAKCGL